jgi:hypothetical protein
MITRFKADDPGDARSRDSALSGKGSRRPLAVGARLGPRVGLGRRIELSIQPFSKEPVSAVFAGMGCLGSCFNRFARCDCDWNFTLPTTDGVRQRHAIHNKSARSRQVPVRRISRGAQVSPDGRRIAFIANVSGVEQIWTKAADSLLAQPIAGTEHAIAVFWSPDSCSALRDFLRVIRDVPFCEHVLDKMDLAERPHRVFFERSDCFIYLDVARRAAPLLRHSVSKSLLHLCNAPLDNLR